MDYNSSSFRNGAIDKLKGKFGQDPDKPKVAGPINLMGVQNALNKGVASLKNFGKKVADAEINNPLYVEKREGYSRDQSGNVTGSTYTKRRQGVSGDRSVTKVKTEFKSGATSYTKSATNPKGGRMIEVTKDKSSKGDVVKRRTRFDEEGDIMTSRSRSKTGKFFQ